MLTSNRRKRPEAVAPTCCSVMAEIILSALFWGSKMLNSYRINYQCRKMPDYERARRSIIWSRCFWWQARAIFERGYFNYFNYDEKLLAIWDEFSDVTLFTVSMRLNDYFDVAKGMTSWCIDISFHDVSILQMSRIQLKGRLASLATMAY